jgi:hypothetical protein
MTIIVVARAGNPGLEILSKNEAENPQKCCIFRSSFSMLERFSFLTPDLWGS